MSIDTLISNPVIINELKTVFGGSTGGIKFVGLFTGNCSPNPDATQQ